MVSGTAPASGAVGCAPAPDLSSLPQPHRPSTQREGVGLWTHRTFCVNTPPPPARPEATPYRPLRAISKNPPPNPHGPFRAPLSPIFYLLIYDHHLA